MLEKHLLSQATQSAGRNLNLCSQKLPVSAAASLMVVMGDARKADSYWPQDVVVLAEVVADMLGMRSV